MANDKNITQDNNVTVLEAYTRIPYSLINSEIDGSTKDVTDEFAQILKFYDVFKKGKSFQPEGTNGDYVPATLRYKMAANLIRKEARFLFAEAPDVKIDPKGDVGKVSPEVKDVVTNMQSILDQILEENEFEKALIQAARDCFIGKRVACVVNFNEEMGVTVNFLQSLDFIFETAIDNPKKLTKFVSFTVVKDRTVLKDKRIYKKKFELVKDNAGKEICYLEEGIYDGAGSLIEEVSEYQPTLLNKIPVVIISNDGLTNDLNGESEIEWLQNYEEWYSKLSNGDIDAGRKSMNPIRYTTDMENSSTRALSTAPGSYWDLTSDQNLDTAHPAVGQLESSLSYYSALKETLTRIKDTAYDEVDMPDIEGIQATLASGKALKAIYWPLIVRCKEKMKTWGPKLQAVVKIIIEGSMIYPNCFTKYTNYQITPVDYEVHIEQNFPLPEDETEEKQNDLAEVTALTMSKKAYMKKWRSLTDDEAMEELEQMALERQLLEDSFSMSDMTGTGLGDDEETNTSGSNIEGQNEADNDVSGVDNIDEPEDEIEEDDI